MRSLLGRFHRPMSRGTVGDMLTMNNLGDGSTLSFDFTTGVLDSRLTFTRASTVATYVNSSGYVATATTNEPRFDYSPTNIGEPKGLLIENQISTINNYGEAFDNAAWTASQIDKTGMTTSQTDPANGTNARILKADANAGRHAIYQIYGTGTNPGTGTLTVWAKSKELGFATLELANAFESKSVVVTFDLATGATSGVVASGMTHVASDAVQFKDGWWRLRLTATLTVGAVPDDRMLPWIGLANASGSAGRSFTASGSGIYIYGAQLEAGVGASSYIPTGASQVTRAVDTAIIAAGTNFSSWYTGGTTGTFVSNWYGSASSTTGRSVIATSDQTTKHLHMYQTPSALTLRLADFGAAATVTTSNSLTANALTKGAFSYNGTATSLCLNGGTVATNTLAFSVAPTFLSIGGPSTNGTSITDTTVMLNNSIRTLKYYPTRLTDAQIKDITT